MYNSETSIIFRLLYNYALLSCIGEGNGNPLQSSCLENPRDRGACWAAVYGIAQSRTRLKWLSSSSSAWLKRIHTCILTSALHSICCFIVGEKKNAQKREASLHTQPFHSSMDSLPFLPQKSTSSTKDYWQCGIYKSCQWPFHTLLMLKLVSLYFEQLF